jgi:protein phosphatase
VVAVLANGSRFSIGHVGDSRVYLFADGTLELLTFDDSWATVVAQDPSLNANDIARNPMRNVLTSVFGARHCRHSLERAELSPGDILLLVSEEVGDAAGESGHMRVRARDIGPMEDYR